MHTNYAIRYSKIWWGLIALLAAMLIWNAGYDLLNPGETTVAKAVVELASNVLYLIPILGYVRQRPYRPRWLWQLVFWVGLILTGMAFAGLITSMVQGLSAAHALVGIASTAFAALCLFSIHEYVNASPHLWTIDSRRAYG